MANAETEKRMSIDVWADVVCPWCYIGEERLAKAIEQSPLKDQIDLQVHTFELNPDGSRVVAPVVEYLAKARGIPVEQARMMESQVAGQAIGEGLVYEVDRPAANTLDMLRVVQYGKTEGLGWQALRELQAYLFAGNTDAFDHDAIVAVASQAGLDSARVREVLDSDQFADEVRADHNQVVQMGATGVPFTVLGSRFGIPGAVSVEQYAATIEQAWEEING